MKVLIKGVAWSSLFLVMFWHPVQIGAQSIKLHRSDVIIDFKEEGYYRSIPYIALTKDMFFITDNLPHRVLKYRIQGNRLEFLRAIGRPGQGPGDLWHPTDISVSADILAVRDESGVTFFDLDGSFKNKFPILWSAGAMAFDGEEVFTTTCDPTKPNLIQAHSRTGELQRSLLDKKDLFAINYDIIKGPSPIQVQMAVFEGLLRTDGSSVYYFSERFGNVLRFDRNGKETGNWDLLRILGKNEKAKAAETQRVFFKEGYDLKKTEGFVPGHYLFRDAQVVGDRLYLLLDNWDISEKKVKTIIEFVEIDIGSWTVTNTFIADTQAKWEGASHFIFLGDKVNPVFLAAVYSYGEDQKLCVFRPSENKK